jgi:hypothetical protein
LARYIAASASRSRSSAVSSLLELTANPMLAVIDQLVFLDDDRPLHRSSQPLGDHGRVDATVDEHDELVTAEARQAVGVAHHVAQTARDLRNSSSPTP